MSETAQPTPETDEKKSRGLGSYVLWAFVAVMVYVLSSGPLVRMSYGPRPVPAASNVWGIVYRPLELAYFKTALHVPIGIYFHLWAPERFDSNGNFALP